MAGKNIDSLGVDVYTDPNRRNLLFMEHSIVTNVNLDNELTKEIFEDIAINRLLEMELI